MAVVVGSYYKTQIDVKLVVIPLQPPMALDYLAQAMQV